jgi:type VI secretion system protein VasI
MRFGKVLTLTSAVVALLCMGGTPQVASAQSSGAGCAAVEDGQARLACYDALFRTEATTETPAGSTGKWTVRRETSRLTDKVEIFMTVESDQIVPSRFGGSGSRAALLLRCQDNTTAMTVWFGGRFMADSGGFDRVTYRIDDKPPVQGRWSASTNNEHMGLWSGGVSIPAIKSMFGARNFLLVATPFNESPITLDFKIGGLEAAIKPLREACAW